MKKAVYFAFLFVLFVSVAEMTLRAQGVKPWDGVGNLRIRVEPGGRFLEQDSLLGYRPLPGAYKVILRNKQEQKLAFHVTNLPDGHRVTHPLKTYREAPSKPEIWILGCSYAYGWSVNDRETYPWLLQEKLPGYEVVNFGVNGYGTLHELIQLREALKKKKPAVAVVTYASFHEARNTFVRSRKKTISPWSKLGPPQPYARLDARGHLKYGMATMEYREPPFVRHSSLVSWLETKYNEWENYSNRDREVSKALLREIEALCKKEGVKLVVAGIVATRGTRVIMKDLARRGVQTVDISVDYSLPRNTNRPVDPHPSAAANREVAEKLYQFLTRQVLPETANR